MFPLHSHLIYFSPNSILRTKKDMLKIQSPLAGGDHNLRPKSGRKPLQPKNTIPNIPLTEIQILKPKPQAAEVNSVGHSNKEKNNAGQEAKLIEPLDASLAEELSSIRKKLERLRLDRERTEKMLDEKEKVLDLQMREMEERGEAQKRLEMEVDRLFRLKELQSYSTSRISPIRSLREKANEKKFAQPHQQEMKAEDLEECMTESALQSPSSSSGSNSISCSRQLLVAG